MKTTRRKREAAPAAIESGKAKAVVATAPAKRPSAISLASHCSVKDAAALKASLCAAMNESEAVTLDVSAVERIDTAAMQLLCAFVRDRSARAQTVSWQGSSRALSEAARLLGVADLLALPAADPAGAAA